MTYFFKENNPPLYLILGAQRGWIQKQAGYVEWPPPFLRISLFSIAYRVSPATL